MSRFVTEQNGYNFFPFVQVSSHICPLQSVTNGWDTLLRGVTSENKTIHTPPPKVGVLVAKLFSTSCSNNGTILLHGGGGGEKASISSLKPAKRQEGPLAVFRANCLNLSLRAVVLLKMTPSSTGYKYSVASDNCLRLCPHTDGSCAGKRSLSDRAYVYT